MVQDHWCPIQLAPPRPKLPVQRMIFSGLTYNKNSSTARVEQTASSAIPSSSSDVESSGVPQGLRQVLRDMAVRMEEFEKEMKKSRQEPPPLKIHSEDEDMSRLSVGESICKRL